MSGVRKILTVVFLVFFLGTMFFSLFHMSLGMDMSGGMTDCPFMSHQDVVCQMNLTDHVGAWKSVFSSAVPGVMLLLAVVGVTLLVASVAPNLLRHRRYISPPQRDTSCLQIYTFSYRPLQELFSNGVLHPKLY